MSQYIKYNLVYNLHVSIQFVISTLRSRDVGPADVCQDMASFPATRAAGPRPVLEGSASRGSAAPPAPGSNRAPGGTRHSRPGEEQARLVALLSTMPHLALRTDLLNARLTPTPPMLLQHCCPTHREGQ